MQRSQPEKKSKRHDPRHFSKRPTHPAKLQPGLASLKLWFQKSRLSLSEQQYKQLWTFHQMLRAKNAEYDLTRIYQFDNMVQKHYIDCVLILSYLEGKLPSPLLDIGTGAGFPGIPLKIACPKIELILAEGRHKRVQFLTEVVTALALQKAEVYAGKIYASFNRPVQGVITRAVETMALTLARVQNCLVSQGKAIFMKGPKCDREISEALDQFKNQYRLKQNTVYSIPHSPHQRRLVVFERQ